MTLFLIGGLLTLAVAAAVLVPFFRRSADEEQALADTETSLYQDQLAEIDRDLARGVLSEDQGGAARTEIERRLLMALRKRKEIAPGTSRLGRMSVIALTALLPLAAGGIYLTLGSPNYESARRLGAPDRGGNLAAAADRHPELSRQIVELEQRLANNPEDAEGYALLARSYASISEYEPALEAYRTANRLTEGSDRRLAGEMAEVMTLLNNGVVPDEAQAIFASIKTSFPNDPQASYYLALWQAQNGDTPGALATLNQLMEVTPPDAPWRPTVMTLLSELGGQAPQPRPALNTPAAPGPTPEMMAAAADMTPEQRAEMINQMVGRLAERLESDPDNLAGWQRLANAYAVLGRQDDAKAAYEQVLRLSPNDAEAQAFIDANSR